MFKIYVSCLILYSKYYAIVKYGYYTHKNAVFDIYGDKLSAIFASVVAISN